MMDSRQNNEDKDGILRQCVYCNKRRNHSGYWEHESAADIVVRNEGVSHCICPRCFHDHFPGEFTACQKEKRLIFKKSVSSDNQVVFEIFFKDNGHEQLLGKYSRGQQNL